MLGFVIGIARLSNNWLVARMAGVYVEIIRNLPLLLQLLFWYNAVLKALPELRDSLCDSRRRISQQPRPVPAAAGVAAGLALGADRRLVVGVVAAIAFRLWARRRQSATGQQAPVLWVALALVIGAAARGACAVRLPDRVRLSRERAASTSAAASRCCRSSWRCCSGL